MKVLLTSAMALGFVLAVGATPYAGASAAKTDSNQGDIQLVKKGKKHHKHHKHHGHHGHHGGPGWGWGPGYGPGPGYYQNPYYYGSPGIRIGPLELF